MTPDRRLDQLEPLMADVLQKVDRLIEGQGQLVELATTTKAELEQVRTTGEITANGLANLTTYVQQGFTSVQRDIADVKTSQDLILQILREKLP
jgi:DNA repair protein RadC